MNLSLVQKKLLLALVLMLLLTPLSFLQAQNDMVDLLNEAAGTEGAGYNTDPELAQTGLAEIVGSMAGVFISLMGVIFMAYVIYGGFLWMTAGGNEDSVSKAKKIIRDGVIGIIVVLAAGGIYLLVVNVLLSGEEFTPDDTGF